MVWHENPLHRKSSKTKNKAKINAEGEERRRPNSVCSGGNCGWSSLGLVRQTCPDPCLVLKTRVCVRDMGLTCLGGIRGSSWSVCLCVFCVCLQSSIETVGNSSNSLIFLTSCHLLWQTQVLFRFVVGLFISRPVSSLLTTSLSSALVFFSPKHSY